MVRQRKRVWYILFFAFVFSVLIYGVLVHLLVAQPHAARPPDPAAMRPIMYGLAGLALLAAIGISLLKMPRASTPAHFQATMILVLAFAEACCIFGLLLFFLGAPPSEFLRFQVATIAVDVLFILPQIVRRPG